MTDLSGIGNGQVPNWDAAIGGAAGPKSVQGGTGGKEGVADRQPLTVSWARRELDAVDEVPDSAFDRNDAISQVFRQAYNIAVPSFEELQKSWGS